MFLWYNTDKNRKVSAHMLIDLCSWRKTSLPPQIECIWRAIEQHCIIRLIYFSLR